MGAPSPLLAELKNSNPTAILEFYHLDLTPMKEYYNLPDDHLHWFFHPGTNEIETNIIWGGIEYLRFPIKMDEPKLTTQGELPRPKITMSNVGGAMAPFLQLRDDLVGAWFSRDRTFVKFIDGVNFPSGENPSEDKAARFPTERYRVDRKSAENPHVVELELAVPWDVEGVKLPRRQILANYCPWEYRGTGCAYKYGPAVADERDNPLWPGDYGGNMYSKEALLDDKCSKTLKACRLRYGSITEGLDTSWSLPFGGFPTSGIFGQKR